MFDNFLLGYNQDGDVKGKQDNARNNDGPYYISLSQYGTGKLSVELET